MCSFVTCCSCRALPVTDLIDAPRAEDYEDGAISESPSLLRVAVDGIGTPSRTPHMQESSVMNKKVQGLCAKLLDAWEQGTLCSADFRSAT